MESRLSSADDPSPPQGHARGDGRYAGLDGLRGLAALTVFFGHALNLVPPLRIPHRLIDSPAHVLCDGTAAVDLFFVLSGFVLALPFVGQRRHQRLRYTSFVIRRLFRIYPAYWVAIGLAIWFRSALYVPSGMDSLSSWIQKFWLVPLTFHDVARHALMIGPSFDTDTIDPVVWSLVTEMRMSLLFPIVVIAVRHVSSWRSAALTIVAALAVSLGAPLAHVHTFTYLPMFVLGAVLAARRELLLAWCSRLSVAQAACLAAFALVLYDVRFALFGFRFDYYPSGLCIAAGSGILILLVAGRSRWSAALSNRPVGFLGRVSYSFYLVHLPVLMLTTSWLYPAVPSVVGCAAIALVASLLLSWAIYTLVEKPFHAIGRTAARLLETPRPEVAESSHAVVTVRA